MRLTTNTKNIKIMSTETKEKKGLVWKSVLIGGVPGILMGTAGMAAAGNLVDTDGSEDNAASHKSFSIPEDAPLRVAECEDDMSFGEAFAAARDQVGPGGVFEWNGKMYNTFTAEEWEEMSDAEKEAFGKDYLKTISESDEIQEEEASEVVDEDKPVEDEADDIDMESDSYDKEVEVDMEDVEVESVEEVVTDEGELVTEIHGVVDGEDVVMIDEDNDGEVDVITEDPSIEDFDDQIDVCDDSFAVGSDAGEDMYADMPDYVNDADPSAFA